MAAGIAVGAFILLMALEVLTEDHLDFMDVAADAFEKLLLVAASCGTAMLAIRVQSEHEERVALMRDLDTARAEGASWRREAQAHLQGLGAAIEKQFQAWSLTDAEREVGLLILKGFAYKDIAALRGTTQATARQQARAICEKSGLQGRAAFSAYFMEDLLPPRQTAPLNFDAQGR